MADTRLKPTIPAQSPTADALETCKGKTVSDWEFGTPNQGNYMSERIILHFTDGTRLKIDIGSNASDVASHYKGLKASDFHTDFVARLEK